MSRPLGSQASSLTRPTSILLVESQISRLPARGPIQPKSLTSDSAAWIRSNQSCKSAGTCRTGNNRVQLTSSHFGWRIHFRSDVLAQWRDERAAWLKLHPQPWDWKTAREYMRKFEEEREHWLDQGHGSCLLREPEAAAIVAESLDYFDQQRYLIDSYVVMPNHVHVLFKPLGEHSPVDILHSWKSFTANALNRKMNREGALWMHESFDTIVRDAEHLRVCREYIAQNPRKAQLRKDDFHFGPARWACH